MEVQTSIHEIDLISKEIRANVPYNIILERAKKSLNSIAARTPIKGFRKGKAPQDLVRKTFGPQVLFEKTTEVASEALEKAIEEHSLRVVGEPQWNLDSSSFPREFGLESESTEIFSFSAKVFVVPEPTIAGTESFQITAVRPEVTEEYIEKTIEGLRKKHPILKPIESRTIAELGDTVAFTARAIGLSKEKSAPQDFRAEIGTSSVPPQVEEALRTTPVGGKTRVSILHREEGKKARPVEFEITVTAIFSTTLPEVDDAFVKLVEPTAQTVEDLRATVAKRLSESFDVEARDSVRSQILNQLVTLNQFEVPPPLIDQELKVLARQFGGESASTLSLDMLREPLEQMAADRVRAQIIVDQVAKIEGISPSVEEVSALVAEQARASGQPVAAVERWFSASRARLRMLELEVVRGKVIELLEGRATVQYQAPAKVEEQESTQGAEGNVDKQESDSVSIEQTHEGAEVNTAEVNTAEGNTAEGNTAE
jgi:trigger factor